MIANSRNLANQGPATSTPAGLDTVNIASILSIVVGAEYDCAALLRPDPATIPGIVDQVQKTPTIVGKLRSLPKLGISCRLFDESQNEEPCRGSSRQIALLSARQTLAQELGT